MTVVNINSLADAKRVAADYGVDWPTGRGKPPVVKLWNAIVDAGDTVAGSYVTEPKPRAVPALAGQRDYDVTVVVERDTKSGKRKMPHRERLNVKQIRELASNTGVRGRVSRANILAALAKLHADWPYATVQSAKIVPVAVTEPSKAAAGHDDPSETKDLVSVDVSVPCELDSSLQDA